MSEQISALIDDEIAVEDAAHLITMLQSNKQAAEAWNQYQLIGDAMRGSASLSPDFKTKLMQKIELEPTILAPNATQNQRKKHSSVQDRLPAKWSIAASIAAVAVVGWVVLQQQTQSSGTTPAIEMAQTNIMEQTIPSEYLMAHQASAPSASSYYIQSASYTEPR